VRAFGRALAFAVGFSLIDLGVYAALYAVIGATLGGLGLVAAVQDGALMAFGRVLYLQWPLQFLFLVLIRFRNWHTNILVVALASLVAFAVTIPLFFGVRTLGDFVRFFEVSTISNDPGPGVVVLASMLIAWVLVFAFAPVRTTERPSDFPTFR
jgi:hypothetical protein